MPFNKLDINNRLIGRLRGNSHYKEDRWDVQIPSINFVQKNEDDWKYPPILLNYLPNDINREQLSENLKLPSQYTDPNSLISYPSTSGRKEAKLRDKYIKIRVRYSGKDLAIITAIHTLYTTSYA